MYAVHGYEPHEVAATTDLMLGHKHPDDRARTFDVLETAITSGAPYSCYHRIIDRQRRIRSVLAVGRAVRDGHGKVEKLVGFFIDLTEVRRTETQNDVQQALLNIAEHRAVIDQAPRAWSCSRPGATTRRRSRCCASSTRRTRTSASTT
jgi:hypothetical protein